MVIGGKVKNVHETGSFVFVTVEAEDRTEIRFCFNADDERVQQFAFRQQVAVEVHTAMLTQTVSQPTLRRVQ